MTIHRTPSDAMLQRAELLIVRANEWLRATSRDTGEHFYVIPSSDGTSAHYTNVFGCTCASYRHRGACSHNEACKLLARRADHALVETVKAHDAERAARNAAAYARLYGDD